MRRARTHATGIPSMPIFMHGTVRPTCTAGISCCPATALSPSEIFRFLAAAAAEAICTSKTEVITSLRTGDASLSFRLWTGNERPPWKRNSRSPCSESAARKAASCSMYEIAEAYTWGWGSQKTLLVWRHGGWRWTMRGLSSPVSEAEVSAVPITRVSTDNNLALFRPGPLSTAIFPHDQTNSYHPFICLICLSMLL